MPDLMRPTQLNDQNTRMLNPIVIVTGANGGVGFGICQRLLLQLSQSSAPSDAQPQLNIPSQDFPVADPLQSLTLVLACRSKIRAEGAIQKLWNYVDSLKGVNEKWRSELRIEFVQCDLSRSDHVFSFCDQVKERFTYVTHLIFNAGGGPFIGVDWWMAIKQFVSSPYDAVSAPKYKVQKSGQLNDEGLGLVWHCNVFGHYIISRELASLLSQSGATPTSPARVLWTSSLEGQPQFYDPSDWQLVENKFPYEGSKYEIDLLGLGSNERDGSDSPIRHIVVHPSCTTSDVFVTRIPFGQVLAYFMYFVYYITILLGSTLHMTDAIVGAISATHAALAPISALPSPSTPVKLGSRVRRGKGYVAMDPIGGWEEGGKENAKALLEKCERLYVLVANKWRGRVGGGDTRDI